MDDKLLNMRFFCAFFLIFLQDIIMKQLNVPESMTIGLIDRDWSSANIMLSAWLVDSIIR